MNIDKVSDDATANAKARPSDSGKKTWVDPSIRTLSIRETRGGAKLCTSENVAYHS